MIIHHAYRLHERITDRRPYELESSLFQIAAQRVRIRSRGWKRRAPLSALRRSVHESPDIFFKTAELLLNLEEDFRVFNRGNDLQAIANDTFIGHQLINPTLVILSYFRRHKIVESTAIIVALSQNRFPA